MLDMVTTFTKGHPCVWGAADPVSYTCIEIGVQRSCIYRLDYRTRKWRAIDEWVSADPADAMLMPTVAVSADLKVVVYSLLNKSSDLYLMEGAR